MQFDDRKFPSIWLSSTKPLPILELPRSLKQDSTTGKIIFRLYVSAKTLKIRKFAILKLTLTNIYSGKEVCTFSQLNSSSPTDYNWKNYPSFVRRYKYFLWKNIKKIKFFKDTSPPELRNSEWQQIGGLIEFK